MEYYRKRIIFTLIVLACLIAAAHAADEPAAGASSGGSGPSSVLAFGPVLQAAPLPEPTPATEPAGNYSRLKISPSSMNVVIEPGNEKDITVTVRNRDTRTVRVQPTVRQQPYALPYVAETSWFTITPVSADIAAGESAKFTITTAVPEGTLRGTYPSMITFTDETYPTPYPQPFPNYIHSMSIMVNIASSPAILISTPYINDQVEAGAEYTYTIDLKNRGSTTIALAPKISDEGYGVYGPYGPREPPLGAKDFIITAPSAIPSGRNGTVTLNVAIPRNASGYYNGYIDLGIDDPSLRAEENRIQISFQIWKQPSGVFSKTFTVTGREPITIELTSPMPMMSPVTAAGTSRNLPRQEPAFDATLTGPSGNANLVLVEKEIRGSVSLGSDTVLVNGDQPARYQEYGSQYTFRYSAEGSPGQWTLAVVPRNSQTFEYKISMETEKSTGIPSLFMIPAGLVGNST